MEKVWGYEQGTAERVKEVTDSFMSFIGKYPSIGPTNTAGKVPPTRCAMAELVLDESLTETLISICKCQGISVTSAIEACFILALQAHAAPSLKDRDYAVYHLFDMRPYLDPPFNTSKNAVNVCFTSLPFPLELPTTFTKASKQLHDQYSTSFKNNKHGLDLVTAFSRFLEGLVATPAFLEAPVPANAFPSSLASSIDTSNIHTSTVD